MTLLDEEDQKWYCYKDDLLFYAKEQLWTEHTEFFDATRFLSSEERKSIIANYVGTYLGGYDGLQPMDGRIILLEKRAHLVFWDLPEPVNTSIPYTNIQILNLSAAWKPVGPVTALISLVISKPRMLNLGFHDVLGILQTIHFKMEESDAINCYNTIIAKVSMAKGAKCRTCGAELSAKSKFCNKCGSAQS